MTNRIDHTDCPHEATSKARAACRKDRASLETLINAQVDALLAASAEKAMFGDDTKWVFYGARRFADFDGTDAREAAAALIAYFAPTGDADQDARRRANGYLVTEDPATMISTVLRAAS